MNDTINPKQSPKIGKKSWGECLVEAGLIDDKTLEQALQVQRVQKKKLGRILIDMGVADEADLLISKAEEIRALL